MKPKQQGVCTKHFPDNSRQSGTTKTLSFAVGDSGFLSKLEVSESWELDSAFTKKHQNTVVPFYAVLTATEKL